MLTLSVARIARALPTAGRRCARPSPSTPLTAASPAMRHAFHVHGGYPRSHRVCSMAQQPAASAQPEGSAPAGSSIPPRPKPAWLKSAEREFMFYRVFGIVASAAVLAMAYNFIYWIPVFGPVIWWGYAANIVYIVFFMR